MSGHAVERSERAVVDCLRAGDEACFARVVTELDGTLRWLARGYLKTDALIDEVVQDTWLAVLRGLDGFSERSTLRTWVCSILVNRARTVASRDARMVTMPLDDDATEVAGGAFTATGTWATQPRSWGDANPARIVASRQALAVITDAIDHLPQRQRDVVVLRDLYGWTASEVCEALGLAEVNQRVMLHRGRSRLRAMLDELIATRHLDLS